jgi:hypothetical protein
VGKVLIDKGLGRMDDKVSSTWNGNAELAIREKIYWYRCTVPGAVPELSVRRLPVRHSGQNVAVSDVDDQRSKV